METDLFAAVIGELFSLVSKYDKLELFSLEYLEEILAWSDLDELFLILTLEERLFFIRTCSSVSINSRPPPWAAGSPELWRSRPCSW
jgi:hypothetical protein